MDIHYHVSSILLIVGYALYTLGVASNAWKFETGYDYGLWYRCGKRECVFYKVDYMGPVNIVRMAILLSSLLLTVSAVCLVIEVAMVIRSSRSKHKQRLGKTVVVTTILAEFSASACLGYYGYMTLAKNDKLPSLRWGFAATGGGVIVLFLGIILKVMGPSSTWSDIPCLKNKAKRNRAAAAAAAKRRQNGGHYIYKPNDTNNKNNKQKRNSRPTKLKITHPSDIITYRKASEPLEGSCENLLVMSRQDSTCSSPHRYEEITLERDFLCGRRTSQTQQYMTLSTQPSPRLMHRSVDPSSSARKASSLPPGISPGFYAHAHRNPRQRNENPYEISHNGPPPPHRHHQQQHHIVAAAPPRLQTTSTLPNPRFQPSSPFRPIRVLTIDRGAATASIRSVPIPSPPPSPPLPPPPPPLSSVVTMETVNIRHSNNNNNNMNNNSLGGVGGYCNPNNIALNYAPSPTSLHSFGSSYAY